MRPSKVIEPAQVVRSRLTRALRAALENVPAPDARQTPRFGSRSAANGKPPPAPAPISPAWLAAGKADGKVINIGSMLAFTGARVEPSTP